MSTVQEIEKAIETLPLAERLRVYRDMPQLIGRDLEALEWQRLALERFFQDDAPDDDDGSAVAQAWQQISANMLAALRQ